MVVLCTSFIVTTHAVAASTRSMSPFRGWFSGTKLRHETKPVWPSRPELDFLSSARSASPVSVLPLTRQSSSTVQSHHHRIHTATAARGGSTRVKPHPVTLTAAATTSLVVGGVQAAATELTRSLVFWENMICGATSRSIAQTVMHPANTMKTMLQNARGPDRPTIATLLQPSNFRRLTVGAGANFLLSMPHGAVNFAVLELVRSRMSTFVRSQPRLSSVERRFGFGLDFLSSSISTVACSIVSTPQMMITDNIMAGNYPNLLAAITGLAKSRGILGFYSGWWPGLVGKIPSYAFTWTFFQQLKALRLRLTNNRPAKDWENSAMGCLASTATVCLMIPMDTIKTRLVSQAGRAATSEVFYTGIVDCAVRVFREEGIGTFYRGLPPRLVSVVPMIGIQFGVYEFMKRLMLARHVTVIGASSPATKPPSKDPTAPPPLLYEHQATVTSSSTSLEEAMMEVAASPEHPFPAPQFSMRDEEPSVPKKEKKHR
jgi:Mitochondrial carrier protein